MQTKYYLAIDIGASSGRHILGSVSNNELVLEEVYRFQNGMDEDEGTLYWDVNRIFDEIITGMKKCREIGKIPESVGIDTWGVDYVLLDENDRLVGKATGYRDHRTDGVDREVYEIISEEDLYERTGIQKAIYNTIYQLWAHKKHNPEQIEKAQSLLMIPDYFHFMLSGVKVSEYTEATTTQLMDPVSKDWDRELIEMLGIPSKLFGKICMPGHSPGKLTKEIRDRVGYDCRVVLPPSHDTASAVLAIPSNDEKTCYISSGTWSLMGVELDSPDCSPESRKADLTNEGGYGGKITYLTNIMGLWMIQSVRNKLAPKMDYGQLCEEASREKISSIVDCQDESFLSPDDMVMAVQDYCAKTGQEVPHTLAQIAAVIYNSLAKCYADKLRLIENRTGTKYERINIIGGGSNAGYLNELTAKSTRTTIVAGPSEATALGNILAQMLSDGIFADVRKARECVRNSFEVRIYK